MKYDFISVKSYDYADSKTPHIIEAPRGYEPFSVSRWPVAGQGIEFWFIREHVPIKRKRRISNLRATQ